MNSPLLNSILRALLMLPLVLLGLYVGYVFTLAGSSTLGAFQPIGAAFIFASTLYLARLNERESAPKTRPWLRAIAVAAVFGSFLGLLLTVIPLPIA